MRIYRYWASRTETFDGGTTLHTRDPVTHRPLVSAAYDVTKKIGSNESQAAAEARLDELFAYVRRVRSGEAIPRDEELALADRFADRRVSEGEYERAICEEFIEEIDPNNLVTRNRYGALALNSTDHAFVDIDYRPATFFERFMGWFGAPPAPGHRAAALDRVRRVAALPPFRDHPVRVYETPKGLRLLIGGFPHAANSEAARKLLGRFKPDPLYLSLCAAQNCFRARLTAKPSRIGVPSLHKIPFPWRSPEDEDLKKRWVSAYDEQAGAYAACRLVDELNGKLATPVVAYHDRVCRADSDLPLA